MIAEQTSGGNNLVDAKSAMISYTVTLENEEAHDRWSRVEEAIYDAIQDFNARSTKMEVVMASNAAIGKDIMESLRGSSTLIAVGLLLLVLYSVIAQAKGCAPSRCRPGTTLVGGFSVLLGTVTGMGVAGAFSDDVRFVAVHMGIIMLTVSVGYNAVY